MLGYIRLKNDSFKDQKYQIQFDTQLDSLNLKLTKKSQVLNDKTSFLCIEGVITQFLCSDVDWNPKQPLESFLNLYNKHNENFVKYIDGLFVLLFKPQTHSPIYIVNNRYEANRMYYFQDSYHFYFSSSLLNLIQDFKLNPETNFGSIKSFLSNGFTISEKTQINGVSKLLPADYFVIQSQKIERKSYWKHEIQFNRKNFSNLSEHIDQYEKKYQDGIKKYVTLSNSKTVGTLLSGGHDTSFVAAHSSLVLQKMNLPKLKTFTVTFPGWSFSEESYAKNISNKFDCEFHEVPFTSDHLDSLIDLIIACEEPVVGSSLPLHHLMKFASSKVDLMLGGDGGDTLWGEYYPVAEYHRLTHFFPLRVRKFFAWVSTKLRELTDWERFWELEHVAHLFSTDNYHDDFLRKLCTYRHFNEKDTAALLRTDLNQVPYSRSHTEISYLDKKFHDALIESKLYNGFYTYQSFHTGKSARHFGMDLYLPTINKRVIDFITQLPYSWVNGGTFFHRLSNNKRINRKFHKQALSRHLKRNEIYNRSFDIPWFQILKPRPELLKLLLLNLKKRGWYNESYLDSLFDQFQNQKVKSSELLELKNHGYRVFTLLSLEIWSLIFIDQIKTTEKMTLEELLKLGLSSDQSVSA